MSLLWGTFRGPVGYVIGGVGAALFLFYGLTDQWWHSLYGFDVTLVSRPHVGLILSILISMIGCLCAFAAEVRRADGRGPAAIGAALGFALTAGVLVAFITPTTLALVPWVIFDRVDGTGVVLALLYPTILLAGAAVLWRPGAATLIALLLTVLRIATGYAIPTITRGSAPSGGST